MASLNLAGKTSGYVKLQAPDDSSNNPVVTLPTESGELALKSDIGEGGGGIPEAPADGKQYARQDEAWTEVEASGGVEAQPPVAFNVTLPTDFTFDSGTQKTVPFTFVKGDISIDTDDSFDNAENCYVIKKEGIYNFNASLFANSGANGNLWNLSVVIQKDTVTVGQTQTNDKPGYGSRKSLLANANVYCKVGEKIKVLVTGETVDGSTLNAREGFEYCAFSGHMVSSIYAPTRMEDVEKAIDKKLAIKDKLIEKLSERLDKLEEKLKK